LSARKQKGQQAGPFVQKKVDLAVSSEAETHAALNDQQNCYAVN
jgi:hypothetical protein